MNNDYLVANEVIHQWFLSVMFYITDKNHWWMSSFASKLFTVKHRSIYLLLTWSPGACLVYCFTYMCTADWGLASIVSYFSWPMWCLYDRIVRPIIMKSSELTISSPLMMMSSNGNIFRVTGHFCGEFTGPRWIPHTKASDAELWCLLWSAPE